MMISLLEEGTEDVFDPRVCRSPRDMWETPSLMLTCLADPLGFRTSFEEVHL